MAGKETYRGQQIEIVEERVYPPTISGSQPTSYFPREIIKINGRVVENTVGNLGTTGMQDAKAIIDRMLDSGKEL